MSLQSINTHHFFQNVDTPQESAANNEMLYDILTYSGYFVAQAIFGVFTRIILIPLLIVDAFFPQHLENYLGSKVTPENDSSGLSQRINRLAANMGITKQFDPYIGGEANAGIRGTNYTSSDRLPFVLSKANEKLTNETLDYLITTELSRFEENHKFYQTMYDVAIAVLEVACVIIFSLWTIPLIEVASSVGKMYLNRELEKRADLKAVTHLRTNRGALSFLHTRINDLITAKDKNVDQLLNDAGIKEESWARSTAGYLFKLKDILITSDGNIRLPVTPFVTANPLTERVKYLEAFKNQPSE